MIKKRKLGDRVRMTAEQSKYYGVVYDAAADKPNATFEEIFEKVFPKGMPAHANPAALKRKYQRAFEMAR
jgi:hypothetical protein